MAIGVTAGGERHVLGVEASPGEDRESWMRFLRSMVGRELSGVRLVTSDAHPGLRDAIARTMHGATWQRCRVHFLRNAMASVPARERGGGEHGAGGLPATGCGGNAHAMGGGVTYAYRERFPRLATLVGVAGTRGSPRVQSGRVACRSACKDRHGSCLMISSTRRVRVAPPSDRTCTSSPTTAERSA